VLDRVHADAVTQQRAAGALARRIDGDNGELELVVLVETETAHEFVGERGLAGATSAGDAEGRHLGLGRSVDDRLADVFAIATVLERGDDLCQRTAITLGQRLEHLVRLLRRGIGQIEVRALDHAVDHALQTELGTVLGREHMGHAVVVQFLDLGRDDHATTTAENLDVLPTVGLEQVDHVLEELDMAALVAGDGDALHILLQRGVDDLANRAVMAHVDHFGTG